MFVLESVYIATMLTSLLVMGYFGNWGLRLIKHRLESRYENKERPFLVTLLLPLIVGSCISSAALFAENSLMLLSSFYNLDLYYSLDQIGNSDVKPYTFMIINLFLILANFLHMASFWSISKSVKIASVRLVILLCTVFAVLGMIGIYDLLR